MSHNTQDYNCNYTTRDDYMFPVHVIIALNFIRQGNTYQFLQSAFWVTKPNRYMDITYYTNFYIKSTIYKSCLILASLILTDQGRASISSPINPSLVISLLLSILTDQGRTSISLSIDPKSCHILLLSILTDQGRTSISSSINPKSCHIFATFYLN